MHYLNFFQQNSLIPTVFKACLITVMVAGLLMLAGCEGQICASGNILDAQTRMPLDSVHCQSSTALLEMYSDSAGQYSMCNPFGSCVPDCPDLEITFSKEGYVSRTLVNPGEDTPVLLEKE